MIDFFWLWHNSLRCYNLFWSLLCCAFSFYKRITADELCRGLLSFHKINFICNPCIVVFYLFLNEMMNAETRRECDECTNMHLKITFIEFFSDKEVKSLINYENWFLSTIWICVENSKPEESLSLKVPNFIPSDQKWLWCFPLIWASVRVSPITPLCSSPPPQDAPDTPGEPPGQIRLCAAQQWDCPSR